ncbi:MAG TPA: response regulator transcription factor [Pseudonocardiaceae bacterium]|nr:response regulator transcription factor [Pseudonocardiaceae bacterium]
MTVRVLLVDDHEVVRRGLRDMLDGEQDIAVVAEAGTVAEAIVRAADSRPDVAVIDMRLPDGDGVALARRLRDQATTDGIADGSTDDSGSAPKCLVLTAFDDEQALVAAIKAGVSGYLLKQVRGQDLVTAVREVAAGRSLLDSLTTARVLDRMRRPPEDPAARVYATLTERERRVLDLIGEGLSNRQIAENLFLAEKTVKNYVTAVLAKLGLERRAQAVAWVARQATSS